LRRCSSSVFFIAAGFTSHDASQPSMPQVMLTFATRAKVAGNEKSRAGSQLLFAGCSRFSVCGVRRDMAQLPNFFKPETRPELRPDPANPSDKEAVTYVRSILWMRVGVGLAGILLPPTLVAVDWLWFDGSPVPRGSMSAYYYSGMREVFVGVIFGTGAFLVGYKIAQVSLDNTASWLAGLGAMILAWFPTGIPASGTPPPPGPTPLQDHLGGDEVVKYVHYGASFAFIGALTVVCILYGIREGRQTPVPGKRSPTFWRTFHFVCASFMVIGIVLILATINHGPRYSLLIGEWTCAWAFGLSWLMKGWERDTLFGRPVPGRRRD
jgi:hypothetical protein